MWYSFLCRLSCVTFYRCSTLVSSPSNCAADLYSSIISELWSSAGVSLLTCHLAKHSFCRWWKRCIPKLWYNSNTRLYQFPKPELNINIMEFIFHILCRQRWWRQSSRYLSSETRMESRSINIYPPLLSEMKEVVCTLRWNLFSPTETDLAGSVPSKKFNFLSI
jgi:hypothetical protein